MRSNRQRLEDILEAIGNVERKSAEGKEAFFENEMLQVWMVHFIRIIGEAAANLPQTLREQYQEILWVDIISMRNFLVHQYFGIDLNQVWDTVTIDLPKLKLEIEAIIQELEK